MSYKIVIINQSNKLYVREYQELHAYNVMLEKLKRSKTQQIRYTCEFNEAIPKHILQEMELSKMAKKKTKEVTPPMAQLEQVTPDPIWDYEDLAPIRVYFTEYMKIKGKWYKTAHPYKEFHSITEVRTWARRHILAVPKSKPITTEFVEPDFTVITIHGLRNYTKSVRV